MEVFFDLADARSKLDKWRNDYNQQRPHSALDRTLATRLTVGALEQAIEKRHPESGLVHHSHRGFQYACAEYVAILDKYRVIPGMSRPANPYDNASVSSTSESFRP